MRIADHTDYRITLHQAGAAPSEKLLITFGGQPSGISDSGFGSDFAALNGWDNIFVAQRHGSQYQGLSLDAFFDAVAPHAHGRDVICYGLSLGAYAALITAAASTPGSLPPRRCCPHGARCGSATTPTFQ